MISELWQDFTQLAPFMPQTEPLLQYLFHISLVDSSLLLRFSWLAVTDGVLRSNGAGWSAGGYEVGGCGGNLGEFVMDLKLYFKSKRYTGRNPCVSMCIQYPEARRLGCYICWRIAHHVFFELSRKVPLKWKAMESLFHYFTVWIFVIQQQKEDCTVDNRPGRGFELKPNRSYKKCHPWYWNRSGCWREISGNGSISI